MNPYTNTWGSKAVEEARKLAGPILIVGASGFIGANLFFSLSNIRKDVFGASRNPRSSWRLSSAPFKQLIDLDATNYHELKGIIYSLKPKTVFNLATYGGYSKQSDIEKIYSTNYLSVLNLLRVLNEIGCEAFVQAGSSSEYGINCAKPKESDELIPNSDYAVSKVAASYLLKYYGKIMNFPCINLRLYSIYGPWEEKDRLVPTLIDNCSKGKLPPFVDKKISRDFVYVDDCTQAFVKAALACKEFKGISINIASGKKTSLGDVAETAKRIFKIKAKPLFGTMENRKWDLENWYGNPSLARKLLGWKASTTFVKGLESTSLWTKEMNK